MPHKNSLDQSASNLLIFIGLKKTARGLRPLSTSADQLVRKFTDRFWKGEWPGNARPRVFYDHRALEIDGPGAVLHAKAMVVDDERVLVTSANFTEAALDRNIELGLLVRDRAMAASIKAHFQGLVEFGVLRLLPN